MAEKRLKTVKKPQTVAELDGQLPDTPFDKKAMDKMVILGLDALGKMFQRLQKTDFNDLSAGDTAHALAFASRAIGQVIRDASFAAGGPDNRTDLRVAAAVEEVFKGLTPEQFEEFGKWQEKAVDPTDPTERE